MKDYDQNKYLRTYRQRHPEKVKRWRLNQYAKYLIQEGWKVIPPNDEAKKMRTMRSPSISLLAAFSVSGESAEFSVFLDSILIRHFLR